jgi:hypothetical protein
MQQLEQVLNRLIEFGLLTNEEEKIVKESFLSIESRLSPKTQYIEFIEGFNKITGKKYKPDTDSRELFYKYVYDYSLTERLNAVRNALTDPYVIESSGILSPKWILKAEMVSKYMNYVAPKRTEKTDNVNKADFSGKITI